jgi:hypothetical protein
MRVALGIVVLMSVQAAVPASRTQVVLLGTGSPPADPVRSGPATAIVVNDAAYLVDIGPALVRRATPGVVYQDANVKVTAFPNAATIWMSTE